MKKTLQHIAVYLLVGTVLVASTGLSIHKLYCYCKGEMVASVFCPDDPCELSDRHQVKGSCCQDGSACHKDQLSKHHDCSDCRSEYVKLDAKYLVFSTDFQINAPCAALPIFGLVNENLSATITSKIAWENDLPPPAGKDLLRWLQTFLC